MRADALKDAKEEAKRFLKRVTEFEAQGSNTYTKESGAVKRSSLDLTRALAKLRKS